MRKTAERMKPQTKGDTLLSGLRENDPDFVLLISRRSTPWHWRVPGTAVARQVALTTEKGAQPLASVAQWAGHHPGNWKVTSWIPLRARASVACSVLGWGVYERQPVDVPPRSMFPSLSLPFSLKSISMASGEDKIKKKK